MTEHFTRAHYEQAADFIRQRTRHAPTFGIVLGSGMGALADEVAEADVVDAEQAPHWPRSTVQGHAGRLVIGLIEGQTVLVQQGRVHFYEGLSMAHITLPVRVMAALGIERYFVTNAAGGINPAFKAGDLMLISDHINLLGMAGFNPLRGPNDDTLGPRFPDMMNAYDRDLRALARRAAAGAGVELKEGVYMGLSGPSFETPADLRFLRAVGADAVGMSTVAEVTVARHAGLKVLGISGISNVASLDGSTPTTHEEVLESGKVLGPKMVAVMRGVLRMLSGMG